MKQRPGGHWLLVAALAGCAILAACGEDEGERVLTDADDDGDVAATTFRVPGSAIQALDSYRFTTQLDVTSAETDLHVTVDGAFQAPDRMQGTVTVRGAPYEGYLTTFLQRPLTSDALVIGDKAWWRAPGASDWQPGIEGYETIDPFVTLRHYATPEFYLEALRFDELTLPVAGREQVNGAYAVRVRLDKQGIIDVLPQGTGIRLYPDPQEQEHSREVFPGILDNAAQVLPEDFVLEVWFDEDSGQPLRIVFDYRVTEQDYSNLSWGFGVPMDLRMELNITDPGADISIQPPPGYAAPTPPPTSADPPMTPVPAVTAMPGG